MKTFFLKYPHAACLILLLLCISTACTKFLDVQPQGEYTEDNYPFPQGGGPFDPYIFGAYNDLRSYSVHVDGFISATSIRSDDADKGSTPSDGGADVIGMDNFPVMSSSGRANALWTGYFGLINKCNNAISKIDSNANSNVEEALKMQSLAEVKFLRAYSYFMLVRLFGRVPKIDRLYEDPAAQNNIPQSSAADLYTFIEEDLNFAALHLPERWDAKFTGRVTRGAAHGLLAKVFLTQQKWLPAMNAANAVITSGIYDLSTAYAEIFSEDGENSKESIFEVQATASASVTQNNGIQYANIQGVRGVGDWNLGWGWNVPSEALASAYEDGDPRRLRTILYSSTANSKHYSLFGEEMPTYPGDVPNPMYNHKALSSPTLRNSISRGSWWMNVRILRYADVVLMYAEAANEVGQSEVARVALNSIRERARRGGEGGVLPDISAVDQQSLRQAIRHERRIELAMEHERFFDLVRWGNAVTALHAAGKTNFTSPRDLLLPIPQTQIDLSKGVLTQNPGY